jgi:hypothetical protein
MCEKFIMVKGDGPQLLAIWAGGHIYLTFKCQTDFSRKIWWNSIELTKIKWFEMLPSRFQR